MNRYMWLKEIFLSFLKSPCNWQSFSKTNYQKRFFIDYTFVEITELLQSIMFEDNINCIKFYFYRNWQSYSKTTPFYGHKTSTECSKNFWLVTCTLAEELPISTTAAIMRRWLVVVLLICIHQRWKEESPELPYIQETHQFALSSKRIGI